MNAPNPKAFAARLREILDYDPATGRFEWKRSHGRARKGAEAGWNAGGYRMINIDGQPYRAHHLAWLLVHAHWPKGILDHINQRPNDNRIENLRAATKAQNMANCSIRAGREISGVTYAKHARAWMARITVSGKTKYLGYYRVKGDAERAYRIARGVYFGEFVPEPADG